jgi:hypothetical protein
VTPSSGGRFCLALLSAHSVSERGYHGLGFVPAREVKWLTAGGQSQCESSMLRLYHSDGIFSWRLACPWAVFVCACVYCQQDDHQALHPVRRKLLRKKSNYRVAQLCRVWVSAFFGS